MNVIWIVADTFRRDHLGCYGNPSIRTPALDSLAAKSMRFDAHYAAGFPTIPTRADHATGRWTISLMGWEPLPDELITLAQLLSGVVPDLVEGRSPVSAMADPTAEGREFVVSTIPFANPGDRVRSVDDVSRPLTAGLVTTVTAGEWSLLFSTEAGLSELYHLTSDPDQQTNLIQREPDTARELHRHLLRFMEDTGVGPDLVAPRRELRL